MKISGIFFCIAILAFLLPFWQVTYNLSPATGLNEGTLTQTETFSGFKSLNNVWVVLTLLIALAGAITAFAMDRRSYMVPMILGILGFILMLFIKQGYNYPIASQSSLQFGYYLAIISFLLAAVMAFLAGKQKELTREQVSNIIPDKVENAFDKARSNMAATGASIKNKTDNTVNKAKQKDIEMNAKFNKMVDKVNDKIDNSNMDDDLNKVVGNVRNVVGPDGEIARDIDQSLEEAKEYEERDDEKK